MGLPGSGKTVMAQQLKNYLETHSNLANMPARALRNMESLPSSWTATVDWFNADQVRKKFNDWDFSREGRIRQSLRMAQFALECSGDYVICDFVAPLADMRDNFGADWTIWMDTIESGRFEDTNQLFEPPASYDFRVTEQQAEKWSAIIGQQILDNRRRPKFDWKKPTVQMMGRWQPWHPGHRALFERLLRKTGQVCVMVRDCAGVDQDNPFDFAEISQRIRRDLDPLYQGKYHILCVPNIVHIGYGRKVGYSIGEEFLPPEITAISATEIRKQLLDNTKTA